MQLSDPDMAALDGLEAIGVPMSKAANAALAPPQQASAFSLTFRSVPFFVSFLELKVEITLQPWRNPELSFQL